ncbi:protein SOSEKI 2-like [Alnus glutinosa]|uniref:protein SOSEKI 2-like n=1 Tax=Alnus glutinosa TaxID=3517 RepID=UPI002D78372C|nr:protein SOSEKI 2-like [Alnus glutinosa]
MDVRPRRARATSPDRFKVYMQPRVKPIEKVQVVYYLSRNGHLEHPHYMEVTHLANQPLRLRDVMDRLTVLRGKGIPSLYSWSCKRSYKSGYVWNDLAENDIIYPAEGAEYVLKGSELVEGCSERFQEIQQILEPNYHSKRKPVAPSPRREPEDQEYEEYEEGEEFEDGEKTSCTSSTTPQSRCSRGVSTDELEDNETQQPEVQKNPTELALNDSSPPSTSSRDSDKANQINNSKRVEDGDHLVLANQRIEPNNSKRFEDGDHPVANQRIERNNNSKRFEDGDPGASQRIERNNNSKRFEDGDHPVANQRIECNNNSKRFEDGDPGASQRIERNNNSKRFEDGDPVAKESGPSRNSVLLQLIACGGATVAKSKSAQSLKQPAVRKSDSLHKGVLCKSAVMVAEEDMIRYMSENPRFGNLQSEEKEYFSGSIVEAVREGRVVAEPVLKRSNSFNEERSKKVGLGEAMEEEKREKAAVKGKCIPRKRCLASSKQTKK